MCCSGQGGFLPVEGGCAGQARLYKIKSIMSSQSAANFLEGHILRRFSVLKKVGSGAYGHVWKVEEKGTKRVFALKKIFDAFQHATDAQRTYRQIEILRQLDHPNIIRLHETIRADNNKDVYLLFEYMEADLHNVIAEGILKDVHIRFILYQTAKALKYLHSGRLIHRDLKPSNILVNSNCAIKLCDFGLVRSLNSSHLPVLTEGVATRWYRSPEVLLGSKNYSTPADVWSFGCIIYEILAQKPLFAGSCTVDQVEKICCFTGYPSEEDLAALDSEISHSLIREAKIPSSCSPAAFLKDLPPQYADLLQRILVFNPTKRITAEQILQHELVRQFHKPEQEASCEREIATSIDDNKKVSVEEYRRLVYGITAPVEPKPKALSSSLGAGSVSPKYQPITHNKSTLTFTNNKQEIAKKYSYERVKPVSQVNLEEGIKKQVEKPMVKYVRSATSIKPEMQPYFRKDNQDVPNREEVDPPAHLPECRPPNFINHITKYTFPPQGLTKPLEAPKPIEPQRPFEAPRPTQQPKAAENMKGNEAIRLQQGLLSPQNIPYSYTPTYQAGQMAGNWRSAKSPMLSATQIKEKVLQFRSAKFPLSKVSGEGKAFQEGPKLQQ